MSAPPLRPGLPHLGHLGAAPWVFDPARCSCRGTFLSFLVLLLVSVAVHAAPRPIIHRLLVYDCASEIGHREVALFDDGTIRLEEGAPGEEETILEVLDPDRLEAFVRRLRQADKPTRYTDPSVRGPGGEWVERCRLEITLPEEDPVVASFVRYDSLSLSVGGLVRIAEDLLEAVRDAAPQSSLPQNYEPRSDDVLLRRDGQRFRVVRSTGDGTGLEMAGLDQPITLYIPRGALRAEFTELLSRRER